MVKQKTKKNIELIAKAAEKLNKANQAAVLRLANDLVFIQETKKA